MNNINTINITQSDDKKKFVLNEFPYGLGFKYSPNNLSKIIPSFY